MSLATNGIEFENAVFRSEKTVGARFITFCQTVW